MAAPGARGSAAGGCRPRPPATRQQSPAVSPGQYSCAARRNRLQEHANPADGDKIGDPADRWRVETEAGGDDRHRAAPITENNLLMPTRTNIRSPSRASVVIAIGIGKPIRNAGGRISAKQLSRRSSASPPISRAPGRPRRRRRRTAPIAQKPGQLASRTIDDPLRHQRRGRGDQHRSPPPPRRSSIASASTNCQQPDSPGCSRGEAGEIGDDAELAGKMLDHRPPAEQQRQDQRQRRCQRYGQVLSSR